MARQASSTGISRLRRGVSRETGRTCGQGLWTTFGMRRQRIGSRSGATGLASTGGYPTPPAPWPGRGTPRYKRLRRSTRRSPLHVKQCAGPAAEDALQPRLFGIRSEGCTSSSRGLTTQGLRPVSHNSAFRRIPGEAAQPSPQEPRPKAAARCLTPTHPEPRRWDGLQELEGPAGSRFRGLLPMSEATRFT